MVDGRRQIMHISEKDSTHLGWLCRWRKWAGSQGMQWLLEAGNGQPSVYRQQEHGDLSLTAANNPHK